MTDAEKEPMRTAEKRIVEIAKSILNNSIDKLAGIRSINDLRFSTGWKEDPIFFPIRGIDSEADRFPPRELLPNFHDQYRGGIEKEIQSFEEYYKDDIVKACRDLIDRFSQE